MGMRHEAKCIKFDSFIHWFGAFGHSSFILSIRTKTPAHGWAVGWVGHLQAVSTRLAASHQHLSFSLAQLPAMISHEPAKMRTLWAQNDHYLSMLFVVGGVFSHNISEKKPKNIEGVIPALRWKQKKHVIFGQITMPLTPLQNPIITAHRFLGKKQFAPVGLCQFWEKLADT